jgi:hypothetical protein
MIQNIQMNTKGNHLRKIGAGVFLLVGIMTTFTGIVSAHSRAVPQQMKLVLDSERWPALPDYPFPEDPTFPDPTDPTPDPTPIPNWPDPVMPTMQPHQVRNFASAIKQ